MKRKQRRYETREEILDLIETAQFQIKLEGHEVDRREDAAKECKIWLGKNPQERITNERLRTEWHEKYNTMISAQERIQELKTHRNTLESKLRMLKDKLAIMDTNIMPFMEDKSIV